MSCLYWWFVGHKKSFCRFLARCLLRSEIEYMERMIVYSYSDEDIQRDGKPGIYHEGKRQGILASLHILLGHKAENL